MVKKRSATQKPSQPTIDKSKSEKSANLVMGEYYCMKELQPKPVTMNFLRVMADKLIEWVDDEEVLSVTEFFRVAKIGSASFYDYMERCPELKRAYSYALDVVGARREVGAMKRKLDTSAVWKTQYHYGKTYREAMEFVSRLSKKEDIEEGSGGGTKIVVIEKIVTDPSMQKYIKKD